MHNHLQQLMTFTRGSEVEFLPRVDPDGSRKAFIDSIVRASKLDLRIDGMTVHMIEDGAFLAYLCPRGLLPAQIFNYPKNDYYVEHDGSGEIVYCTFRYCYKQREPGQRPRDRYARITMTPTTVEKVERDSPIDLFEQVAPDTPPEANPFGFIPCVEILNPAPGAKNLGHSDFEQFEDELATMEDITNDIIDNIATVCSNPIITTGDAEQLKEVATGGMEDGKNRHSAAYASGFRAAGANPKRQARRKLKQFIGDVDPEDRFEQLRLDALPEGQLQWASSYEKSLREALGGVSGQGLETATEVRTVYGGVFATAARKRAALFKHGLCRLFEMALLAEEQLGLATDGRLGLPMMGDRTVDVRVGSVFAPTTRDLLDKSIVSRNLMRQGVNAKEALKMVFDGKSENELDMLVGSGGLPSEFLQDAIGLLQQLAQTTDPVQGTPIADPNTGLPLIYTLIPFIAGAMNYGQQFNSTTAAYGSPSRTLERVAAANVPLRAQLERIRASIDTNGGSVVSADDQQSTGENLPEPGSTRAKPAGNQFFDLSASPILNGFKSVFSGIGNPS